MLKRVFILLTILTMLVANSVSACALTSEEKDRQYNAAVMQLESYLSDYKNDTAELEAIYRSFSELRGYEQSKFLGYYVSVLIKLSIGEYDYEMRTFPKQRIQ